MKPFHFRSYSFVTTGENQEEIWRNVPASGHFRTLLNFPNFPHCQTLIIIIGRVSSVTGAERSRRSLEPDVDKYDFFPIRPLSKFRKSRPGYMLPPRFCPCRSRTRNSRVWLISSRVCHNMEKVFVFHSCPACTSSRRRVHSDFPNLIRDEQPARHLDDAILTTPSFLPPPASIPSGIPVPSCILFQK